MLIGGHVSTAGGLVKAHERGVERGCDAIQVFNQSPRMWRPTTWKPNDVEAFLELMDDGPIKSVVIHAVYLINPGTKDKEMRKKSLASLTHSLRMGDAIGADGVVVHPGSRLKEPLDEKSVRLYRSPGHQRDWLNCIRSRKKPICDVEIGARSVTVCHLGNLAYWNHRKLRWDPAAWKFVNDAEADKWLDRERRDPWLLPSV